MSVENNVRPQFFFPLESPQRQPQNLWTRLTTRCYTFVADNALRGLLQCRYYFLHPRSPISKIHQFVIAWLTKHSTREGMDQYSHLLPTFPVNPLRCVVIKLKRSLQPVMEPSAYETFCRQLDCFAHTDGTNIQARVERKAKSARNWMEQEWQGYAYLENRFPNNVSNYFGLGALLPDHRYSDLSYERPAKLIHLTLCEREKIKRGEYPSTVDDHPFCMNQYKQVFGSNRLPGEVKDTFEVHDSNHICVFLNGHSYKVTVYSDDGAPLHEAHIAAQLRDIAHDAAAKGRSLTPARLTWQNRVDWAKDRALLVEANRANFDAIDQAIFTVRISLDSPETEQELAKLLFLSLEDQWADKGTNLTFCQNGMYGSMQEHTMAEATIMTDITERVAKEESLFPQLRPSPPGTPPPVEHLDWVFTDALREKVQSELPVEGECYAATIDFAFEPFSHFGKAEIKKWHCSPDSIVQVALQLAYTRKFKKVPFTYETQTARRFYRGRTETVRSTTKESSAFCEAMDNPSVTAEEKRVALKAAVKKHVELKREAFVGLGIDRQLMMLRRNTESSETALPKEPPFDLLTSQTPIRRVKGGGFGPGTGTGVSYHIENEGIHFHISRSRGEITSASYYRSIEKALLDLKALFQ